MPGRVVMFVIPTAAVAVTALVLLGPGAQRAALGVRVRGVPVEGGRTLAFRLEGVRSLFGVEEAAAVDGLDLEVNAGGAPLETWAGATGADGIGEARISSSRPISGQVGVVVRQAPAAGRAARVLAEGLVRMRSPSPAVARPGTLHGAVQGDVALEVSAARGILAAPFAEELRVTGAPGLDLTLSVAGGEVVPEHLATDEQGHALVRLKPLAHQVELTIRATDREGHKGLWEGTLPVVPGAAWIDPASTAQRLLVVSPASRERAYLSLWDEAERIDGAVVPLTRDPDGFFRGAASFAAAYPGRLLYATVAGDPLEQGVGTVAWPIQPPSGAFLPVPLELLLDGVPVALHREQDRAAGARRSGAALVGAAALAEILLLVLRSRAAQRRLEAHLAEASSSEGLDAGGAPSATLSPADRERLLHAAREHPVLWALAFAAMIAFAFAMVAAVATFR